jgi:adenylate cyclase
MRRWLIGLTLGLLIGFAGVAFDLSRLGASFEETVGLSWMFLMRGTVAPPPDVVIVAMDSRTGEELDLPTLPRDWPRSIHADLVDALVARGASVIVFDVHFGRAKDEASDQVFVSSVARAGNVVLVELLTGRRKPISDQNGRHVGMVWEEESIPPFAALADAAAGVASFPLPKEGASVYKSWIFKESADQAPTLPAVALQLHARDEVTDLLDRARAAAPGALEAALDLQAPFADAKRLRNFMRGLHQVFEHTPELASIAKRPATGTSISLSEALDAMYAGESHRFLNFYGPPGTIPTVPYPAVIKGSDPNVPEAALDFTGKVVFVGFSDLFDPGQPDRFYTVFTREDGVDLSGVEIAATAFANLLTDRSLTPVDLGTAVVLLFLFGIVIGTTLYLLPGSVGVPVAIALAVGYAFVAQHLFTDQAMILPIATPLLVQAPAAIFFGLLGQYLLERRRGQRISEAINYYLPDDIARDLVQNRLDPGKLNQVVYSTCLATDMAGFSTIAENLPPGELAKVLNDYFETLAAPLKKHGVHVTEFRADAIMCAWTDEKPTPTSRRQALLAALEAGEAIKDFRRRHNMPGARLRIGLEAGSVYVGHAGGGGRFVYSIVGDSANTASRIEGLNKHVGTQVLASGSVVEGFENLLTRFLGAFQFVGKTEAIPIYEVVAERETATAEQLSLCDLFGAGLAAYQQANWEEAASIFQAILDEHADDGPSKFFLARCRRFLSEGGGEENPRVVRMEAK